VYSVYSILTLYLWHCIDYTDSTRNEAHISALDAV